jgi:hypothetical protein
VTGEYVTPDASTHHAVKVFIPGLIRSDASFLHRVIVTVRPWREYVASMKQMVALEARNQAESGHEAPGRMPPHLEWWEENFALVRDISVRGYACHVQSYDGVLADPRGVLEKTFAWICGNGIGREADLDAAVAAVRPQTRRQHRPAPTTDEPDPVPPHVAEVFDGFYAAIHAGHGLDGELIARMNTTNAELGPEILEHRERLAKAMGLSVVRGPGADDGPFAILDGEWA